MRELKIQRSVTKREEDSLRRYFADITRYRMISPDEEVMLTRKIKGGDEEAVHRLVKANLRFVVSVAKKYEGQGLPLADLISEGNSGLFRAARRFDETRGIKFISFAVWWIRQSIMAAINEQKRMVRLPGNRIGELTDILKAEMILEQKYERLPSNSELSEYLEIAEDKVRISRIFKGHIDHLDHENAEDGQGLYSVLEDPMFPPADESIQKEGLSENIGRMLRLVSPRQHKILCLYYGIGRDHQMQIDDIAVKLGVSNQCVQMNKTKALKILRQSAAVEFLKEYII